MSVEQFYYIVFVVLADFFGLAFGSFLNVLIYRVPRGESIVKGGSHCTKCQNPIKFYDNIPVLSYLILGGKCRHCGERISPRYIVVESLNALLWVVFALLSKDTGYVYAVLAMFFTSTMITVAFIDGENGFIPDRFNIFIAVLGIVACFFDGSIGYKDRLFGLLFTAVFFGGTYFVAKYLFKKEALGFGDVKLTAAAGLFLGFRSALFSTLIGCVLAAVVLTVKSKVNDDEKGKEYPFAPFLAFGFILGALIGNLAVEWYLGLFSL